MFRIAVFVLLLFAVAAGFAWLADNPGTVTVQWDWWTKGEAYEFNLIVLIMLATILLFSTMLVCWIIYVLLSSPKAFGRWRSGRRRDKGYAALSKGLVAAGAGNVPLAKQLARESGKLLENEPLVAMLEAQTSLLEGDNSSARKQFRTMLDNDDTRLLALRGLYIEAEQEGQLEAASHFAKQANTLAPGTPWAAKAVFKTQSMDEDWEEALRTLELNRSNGVVNKDDHSRKKAVLLTALALKEEDSEPQKARTHALAAHKLAPELVPAATTAARLCIRLNETRKATKTLETAWKRQPHPELAHAYINLLSGDSAAQKLKRADKLTAQHTDSPASQLALAEASMQASDFDRARKHMENVLKSRPTEKACLLMADIEEAEHGDKGRVREWLSRAVTAPKDPTWIADGTTSDEWAPLSPITGLLDAYEWKAPAQQLSAAPNLLELGQLVHEPLASPEEKEEIIDLVEVSSKEESSEIIEPVKSDDNSPEKTDEKTVEPVKAEENKSDAPQDKAEDEDKDESKTKERSSVETHEVITVSLDDNDKEKTERDESGPDGQTKSGGDSSPYRTTDLDIDKDGIIDRKPDDPGTNGEPPKKKGWLF